jgi:hypothetical protein
MITAFTLDEGRYLSTGRLFDGTIEDDNRIAYHGTSLLFSGGVESRGLSPKFELFDFEVVLEIAAHLPPEQAQLSDSLRQYAEGRGTRLSFSPVSRVAAGYAYTFGGQISCQLRRAVNYGVVSEKTLAVLNRLMSLSPCVYAVDLSHIADEFVTAEVSGSIYVSTMVCPESLVCRMDLPLKKPKCLSGTPANAPTAPQLLRRPETIFSRLFRKTMAPERPVKEGP